MPAEATPDPIAIRTSLRPGDLEGIVTLHGLIYSQERGWDDTFEAYVAGPLSEFVRNPSDRQRLWIAERNGQLAGCIAIVPAAPRTAQLRWFLVEPSVRGVGLGKRLLDEALVFCKDRGYAEVMLWTERSLTAAAKLYRAAGFRKTEEKARRAWGAEVVEEKYELKLA
jgi:ribosomal protein S18 acetylase RimI-like enzyme